MWVDEYAQGRVGLHIVVGVEVIISFVAADFVWGFVLRWWAGRGHPYPNYSYPPIYLEERFS